MLLARNIQISVVVIVALCVALGLAAWYGYSPTRVPVARDYVPPPVLVITHRAEGETHFYSGSLDTQECDNVRMSYTAFGTEPPSAEFHLTVVETQGCAYEGRGERPFSISLQSASSSPTINAVSINGAPQEFTVVEAE